jgi:hypothetical protein
MADAALQALLDASGNGTGIMITSRGIDTVRVADSAVLAHYYVTPQVGPYARRSRWVEVVSTETDAQKNTAIRAALAKP